MLCRKMLFRSMICIEKANYNPIKHENLSVIRSMYMYVRVCVISVCVCVCVCKCAQYVRCSLIPVMCVCSAVCVCVCVFVLRSMCVGGKR